MVAEIDARAHAAMAKTGAKGLAIVVIDQDAVHQDLACRYVLDQMEIQRQQILRHIGVDAQQHTGAGRGWSGRGFALAHATA